MEALTFKTNIKCLGCVAQVTPEMQQTKGITSWEVDITTPDKILTVQGPVAAEEIIAAVNRAGYQATPVEGQTAVAGA